MQRPNCCKSYNVYGDPQILIFLLVQKNMCSLSPFCTRSLTSAQAEIWFFMSSDRGWCRTNGPLPNLGRLTVCIKNNIQPPSNIDPTQGEQEQTSLHATADEIPWTLWKNALCVLLLFTASEELKHDSKVWDDRHDMHTMWPVSPKPLHATAWFPLVQYDTDLGV